MKIYVDLLMLLNTLFNYVLFSSVNYILRRNVSLLRIIIASFIGNISILLLEVNNGIVFIIGKVLIAIIINVICFGYKDIRYLCKNVIYFYLVSMLLGGVMYFFSNEFMLSDDGLVSVGSNGIRYLVVVLVSVVFMYWYLFRFKELRNNYSSYYSCFLYIDDDNTLKLSGFLDTGNKLKDPYSNKNIILVNKEVLGNINIRSPIYVPYNSLNNHGLLTCFKVKKIVINGKENDDFLVGISNEKMYIDGIDCILNTGLMEGLR